ncbi:MAG: 3-deoxy-manno-octulosonate cytidylyltransferase [Thermodesulfovibrio sp.]|nr:3-deoxy-manno-octulosonate cytidylyltransferase [Thermodesulfovibrio sp.]
MSSVVVIPARYGSTRFPGKPLAPLKGIPVIQHVYQNSRNSLLAADIVVATDNDLIRDMVRSFGGTAVMTSPDHASGTDRIAEALRLLGREYDIIVNVQGDEPLIRPEMIDAVISVLDDENAAIGTLVRKIDNSDEIFDSNVVKAVFDEHGYALYFSRAPIPFHRDVWKSTAAGTEVISQNASVAEPPDCFKHIGIYSYRREALLRLTSLEPSRLEQIEKLEQLRALEHGLRIKVRETDFETFGVDTPEDLERIEKWLNLSL